jgi:hypothetical protein
VRVLHNKGRKALTREEVVELTPNRRVSYVLLSGLVIRDYQAFTDLEPDGDGTAIRRHAFVRARDARDRPALPAWCSEP